MGNFFSISDEDLAISQEIIDVLEKDLEKTEEGIQKIGNALDGLVDRIAKLIERCKVVMQTNNDLNQRTKGEVLLTELTYSNFAGLSLVYQSKIHPLLTPEKVAFISEKLKLRFESKMEVIKGFAEYFNPLVENADDSIKRVCANSMRNI